MTRFREEVYGAAWYKAAVKKSRLGEVSIHITENVPETLDAERRALRTAFFAKTRSKYAKTTKQQLNMEF